MPTPPTLNSTGRAADYALSRWRARLPVGSVELGRRQLVFVVR